MFLVGLELDLRILRGLAHATVVTSHVSIIFPFFLGSTLAIYLYPRLSDDSVSFTNFALFMGAALSITAFPVLARILTERKLLKTRLGSIAIACAAVDDVTGWCILAGIVLLARAGQGTLPLWAALSGILIFTGFMWFVVRRLVARMGKVFDRNGTVTQGMLVIILLLVLVAGWTTEWLGIHAVFGAFIAGVIMPKNHGLINSLTEKINDVAVVLLLPLFFAFVGLQTQLGLLNGAMMWFYAFLILAAAVIGKFGGSTLSARFTGLPWRESASLGVLMNTRGLMELVLLTIGLDIGVISPALFSMLVLMAITTTFMTSPILEWIYFSRVYPKSEPVSTVPVESDESKIDQATSYPVIE
jgi:Kef-type K+ transport system membrane component KefB